MHRTTARWRSHVSAWAAAAACAVVLSAGAGAHEVEPAGLDFTPPAPGSYRLERIMRPPQAKVVDALRRDGSLSAYTRGKVTLLSLMYTACSDEKGCPLAFYSLVSIRRDLEKRASARGQVRVVSLSFDPEHDTPEVMRAYGRSELKGASAVPWHFLSPASREDLSSVLDGFDQDVSRPRGKAGKDLGHVLKLFLIDREGWVREIYTSAYLAPKVVLNDIETLLREQRKVAAD